MKRKGRDNEYKCAYCGRYISYADFPDKIGQRYTPDSEHTSENWVMWHKTCGQGVNHE